MLSFNNDGTVEWLPLRNLILNGVGFPIFIRQFVVTLHLRHCCYLIKTQNTGGEFRIGGFIFREETSYDSLQLQRVAKTRCAPLYRTHFLSSSRKHDFNIK